MIDQVILWTNGEVSCFDETGEQMPDYQGQYGQIKEKILAFYRGPWKLAEWNRGLLAMFNPALIYPLEGEIE